VAEHHGEIDEHEDDQREVQSCGRLRDRSLVAIGFPAVLPGPAVLSSAS
jgi:hypothetical protein